MTPEAIATELRTELMAGVLRPGAELSQVEHHNARYVDESGLPLLISSMI